MDHFERQLAQLMRDTQEHTPFEPQHQDRLRAGVRARRRARAVQAAVGSVLAVAGLSVGLFLLPDRPVTVEPSAPHPRPAFSPESSSSPSSPPDVSPSATSSATSSTTASTNPDGSSADPTTPPASTSPPATEPGVSDDSTVNSTTGTASAPPPTATETTHGTTGTDEPTAPVSSSVGAAD